MTPHHELLQDTMAQDRNVMSAIRARSPYVFRSKKNFRSRFLGDVIADHTRETVEVADLAKSRFAILLSRTREVRAV